MGKIGAVVFDMGGTIFNYKSTGQFIQMMNSDEMQIALLWADSIMREISYAIRSARTKAQKSMKEFSVFQVMGHVMKKNKIGIPVSEFMDYIKKIYDIYTRDLSVFPNVHSTLHDLKCRHIKVGLVSNTCFPSDFHIGDLSHFELSEFFNFALFSSKFGKRKPHKTIYKEALRLLSMKPSEVLFVGDQIDTDVVGPRNVGMKSVLYRPDGRRPKKGIEHVSDLSEVIDIVKKSHKNKK